MSEYIEMMKRCRGEILGMRNEIGRLQPQAEAYKTIRQMVGIMAPKEGGYASQDLVYVLDREIEKQEAAELARANQPKVNEGEK